MSSFNIFNTNQQASFLKSIQNKQKQQQRQSKINDHIIKVQSNIRKYRNRQNIRPFIQESTEKLQSIVLKRPTYGEEKFIKMMNNAFTKIPFFFQTLAFINHYNYLLYENFVVTFIKSITDFQNTLINNLLLSDNPKRQLFIKFIGISIKLAEFNALIFQFIQTTILTIHLLSLDQLLLPKIVYNNNFSQCQKFAFRGLLGNNFRKVVALKKIQNAKNQKTRIIDEEYLSLILQNKQLTLIYINVFEQIYQNIQFKSSSQIIEKLKEQQISQLQYRLNISYSLLQSLNKQTNAHTVNILLGVHRKILVAYSQKRIAQIKKHIFKKTMIETSQNKWIIMQRVKYSTKYSQFIATVNHPFYQGYMLQLFSFLLQLQSDLNNQNKSIMDNIINIYFKIIDLQQIQKLVKLCSRQNINLIANYFNFQKIKLAYIDENLETSKMVFMYLLLLDKHFTNMDDFQFTNLQMSFPKQFIMDLVKSIYKLTIFIVNKKKQSPFIQKVYETTVSLMTNIYNKNSRTSYFDNAVFSGEQNIQQFNYSMLKISGVQKHLHRLPFIIPFNIRYKIFQDYYNEFNVKVRRGHEFEDAFQLLKHYDIRKGFQITFVGQSGAAQIGVDAGGLTKQFLNRVIRDAFNPKRAIFIQTGSRQMIPNPFYKNDQIFQFIGKLVAKAILNFTLVPIKFSNCFINLFLGRKNTIQDLKFIDKQYYNNIMKLKHSKQDISELDLTFSIMDKQLILLKQNGNLIPVTNQNKLQFIQLLADYKTNKLYQYQSLAFRKGFERVIPSIEFLNFNYDQLNMIISGRSMKINVLNFKSNVIYQQYDNTDKTILDFWKIVKEMTDQQRIDLLKYVTSCSRPPVMGFEQLKPKFKIAKFERQDKSMDEYLPRASTCVNTLYLPDYQNEQILRNKLLYAIKNNEGFGEC